MSEHEHEWRATGYTMPEYACERGVSERDATQQRIAALEAENARMRAVVEAIAVAGVGDESSGGSWLMFAGYDAETIRQQARAILASASDGGGNANEPEGRE